MFTWLRKLLGSESEEVQRTREWLKNHYTYWPKGVKDIRGDSRGIVRIFLEDPLDKQVLKGILEDQGYEVTIEDENDEHEVMVFHKLLKDEDDEILGKELAGTFHLINYVTLDHPVRVDGVISGKMRLLTEYLKQKYGK